ncbi:MAG: EamA family transporter, partial [Rhodospirillaceae bacterium]|nr:EamA family transporter [Rhodospirillaceae bacterium]MBT3910388.1 EamA family transporter [Rhodospirillaceae bacterium]
MAGNGAIAAVPSPPIFLAALAAGLFSAVIWGATPAATAFAVLGMEPLTAGLLRTVLAMPIVLIIAIMAKLPLPGTRREWALLLISSLCGFLGFTLIFTIGIAQTSTSHAGLILAGVPLLTGLAG